MVHDHESYGDFAHFDVLSEDDGIVVECTACPGGRTVLDTDDPASLADIVKAAARHEEDMTPRGPA